MNRIPKELIAVCASVALLAAGCVPPAEQAGIPLPETGGQSAGESLPAAMYTTAAPTLSVPADGDFVNIHSVDASIVVDLRYATPDNFTGRRLYHFTQAVLRYSTAEKLAAANALLKEQGYVLKVWDAYRPLAAQQALWDACPDPNFVAPPDPDHIAGHPLGATVDVTLCTADGLEAAMQSGFDDFARAARSYPRSTEQERLYRILDNAMTAAGFVGYIKEWWHYADSNQDFTPVQVDPTQY
ncbi:MAG: M15 family metallopeptidase [Oscillospiraceae bacterium]|nr:M15 family metallopeptidase [Oscillospiraceae bacterium]